MKKLLDRKVSVRSLLIVVCVMAVIATVVAAAPSSVQATLSPDITVKYNGAVQTMKDANGAVVYPLMYKGTTYVPIRAVSTMLDLPVNWDGATRTVYLGSYEKQPVSFLTVATKKTGYAHNFTTNKEEFPIPVDEFGAPTGTSYTDAIKVTEINSASKEGDYALSGTYQTMTFTAYAVTDTTTIRLRDKDTDIVVWEGKIEPKTFVSVTANISGIKVLRIEAAGKSGGNGTAYLLDPRVK